MLTYNNIIFSISAKPANRQMLLYNLNRQNTSRQKTTYIPINLQYAIRKSDGIALKLQSYLNQRARKKERAIAIMS